MGFWDNVLIELDYLGMTNKALAHKCGFDPSSIGRGIKLGSSPSADTAVKIAKELNVSVEYLVSGNDSNLNKSIPDNQLQLLHKYAKTISKLDSLPEPLKLPIIHLIDEIVKD